MHVRLQPVVLDSSNTMSALIYLVLLLMFGATGALATLGIDLVIDALLLGFCVLRVPTQV